jgi:hypothetical protein
MFRALRRLILAGLAAVIVPCASAQCLPAACSLTLTLQSDASGIVLGGSGTSSASMSFGTMQAFSGSVPSGVTKSVGSSNWKISTPFDVKVTCENLTTLLPCTLVMSASYTLTAQLQSSDSTNTWQVGSSTLSSSSASTLTASGTYSQATAYSFALTIPFVEPSGTISNSINFVATAN